MPDADLSAESVITHRTAAELDRVWRFTIGLLAADDVLDRLGTREQPAGIGLGGTRRRANKDQRCRQGQQSRSHGRHREPPMW